ncbi:ESX secretion-associated protein EspG [Nocardia sp. CA-120079]|uniref:ESX secretion-associated protein EspG n=1 Tax=Nocardia sp. CA-120079 TaxID=3239974 RepID=UPI003D97278C
MRWEFTPDEFIYVWGQLGADRIPAPLSLTASVRWRDEWEAIDRNLRERLQVIEDPDLLPVLRTAADPDISLMLVGSRNRKLRAFGAVTTNIGVTIVQRAGAGPDFGGNVVIEVGSAALVPKVFAAVAGEHPPGQTAGMVETFERLQDTRTPIGLIPDEPVVADRMRSLLAAPRSGHGHIEVQCDRHASNPPSPRYLSWFDVDGDGRYIYLRRHRDFHIDPCSTEGFRSAVSRLMGRS